MSWTTILPPIIVLVVGFFTKRICLSLFIGMVAAAAIATHFSLVNTALLIVDGIATNLDVSKIFSGRFVEASNFFIIVFVLSLGILIEMIMHSHAAAAFVEYVKPSIKSKKSAETATLVLSHCLSIDDYLSSLTVGSVMRPLTDRFRIPRVKLAFLTDSMSAPLAILTPISSWAAAIIGFLTENGVHSSPQENTLLIANPYSVYLNILPYIFYSISLILSVWMIVRFRISFGLMREHEEIAENTGNLAGGKAIGDHISQPISKNAHHATIVDFLVPLCTLLASTLFFLLYCGDSSLFGGTRSLVATLQNAPISLVLFFSGITALATSAAYFLINRRFTIPEMALVAWHGLRLMLPVAAILIFCWTMGDFLREHLKTGEWLASLFSDSISMTLMPLILFWNSALVSLALGSSWATTAMLFPIALPMVLSMAGVSAPAHIEELPIIFSVFGAVLSGAVCGDHISLISSTTIMAMTSALCDHMDHFKTQLMYSIPVFIGSSFAFLLSGLLMNTAPLISLAICLSTSVLISGGILFVLGRHQRQV